MKTTWTTILALFIVWSLPAQIFEDFEGWQINGDYTIPLGWTVNLDRCVLEEEPAFYGQRAMRVRSLGPSFEGYAPGIASKKFLVPDNALGMSFSILIDSLFEGGSALLRVLDDQDEVLLTWESDELIPDYEEMNLSFDTDLAGDSIKIEWIASTTIGPLGFDGYLEMAVDKMQWLTTNSIDEKEKEVSIQLFPNPASTSVQVQSSKEINYYVLYDLLGSPLQKAQVKANQLRLMVKHLPKGAYLLQLTLEDNQLLTKRLIVK